MWHRSWLGPTQRHRAVCYDELKTHFQERGRRFDKQRSSGIERFGETASNEASDTGGSKRHCIK